MENGVVELAAGVEGDGEGVVCAGFGGDVVDAFAEFESMLGVGDGGGCLLAGYRDVSEVQVYGGGDTDVGGRFSEREGLAAVAGGGVEVTAVQEDAGETSEAAGVSGALIDGLGERGRAVQMEDRGVVLIQGTQEVTEPTVVPGLDFGVATAGGDVEAAAV